MPSFLADILVAAHLAIVLFVVGTPFLVFLGWPLGWRWIRKPWLRYSHLAIMGYIVMNAIRGELCFLTNWETALRERAGETVEDASFVGRMLHSIPRDKSSRNGTADLRRADGRRDRSSG